MLRIVGLMSGTSLDGVDAAWVETDGERVGTLGPALTLPYDPALRRDLRRLLELAPGIGQDDPFLKEVEARLTDRHIQAMQRVSAEAARAGLAEAELLGFHGQTILHRPIRPGDSRNARGFTWQIGDARALARGTGRSVAFDFRTADVAAGGQGAPLVPIAHAALAWNLPKPLAVLNLGGVANVTWLGPDGDMMAFDTGPANGPLDDWAKRSTGSDYDKDGNLAKAGQVDGAVLGRLMEHPYLAAPAPKSLDRLDFDRALREAGADRLSPQDGAATLVSFAAVCVAIAARHFPEPPMQWLVAGGGRRNGVLMKALRAALPEPVRPVEVCGWNGDALEAQCFAVLAARTARGLPISFPATTGAPRPLTGGQILGGLL
jgi:anhydro-N-acetylmuramic acid kinase